MTSLDSRSRQSGGLCGAGTTIWRGARFRPTVLQRFSEQPPPGVSGVSSDSSGDPVPYHGACPPLKKW